MLDVVCFGEILWDMFEQRSGRGVTRSDAEPIARTFQRQLGGAPANVATGLSRLGVRAAVVGGVGRDRFGDALCAHLAADGVDTRFIIRLPNRTGLTFVFRDKHGEPDFLFYRHDSADLSVRAEHLKTSMGRARWVLVGTSTLMTADLARATERFLDHAVRGGACVFVDLNVRSHLWADRKAMHRAVETLVARAALVKASDADLHAVADRGAGLKWLDRFAPRASWLVTRGSGPASAIGKHGEVSEPARKGRCVDATGAGDAFIAGALATLVAAGAVPGSAAWARPALWRSALRVGHMMGKKAVSKAGAVTGVTALGAPLALVESVRKMYA